MKALTNLFWMLFVCSLLNSGCKKLDDQAVVASNTFYADVAKGNDTTGNGSQSKPFRSITKALSSLYSGDILLVNNGNYGDVVAGRTPGKDWGASPSEITVPYSNFTSWVTVKAAPGQTPHFRSLSIGTLNIPNSGSPALKIPFTQKGNCDVFISFEGLVIDDGVCIKGSRYVNIKNCTINKVGDLNGSVSNIDSKTGIDIVNGRYIFIENNTITHVAIGIQAGSYDLTILNNNIHHNSHDGIRVVGGDTWLIEGNQIHDLDDGVNDDSGYDWNRHTDGIQIFTNFDVTNNLIIRRNIFYHLESMGIMVNESSTGSNYQNWIFENNIFGPTGGYVVHLGALIKNGCVFRHNTLVYAPNDSWQSIYRTLNCQNYHLALWAVGSANNGYRFYNNILTSDSQIPADYDFSAGNIFYNHSGTVACPYEPITGSLTTLITSGKTPGTLTSASSAFNTGVTNYVSELTTDFLDNARDNKPDVGALERK